jgi:acyl-CoA synthetase
MKPFLTLHHPATAKSWYDQGLWQDDTFYDLMVNHAARHPRSLALRDGRVSLSWAEIKAWTDIVATDLVARGLGKGDRLSIWMSNRVETIITFLACSRLGLACNPSLHRNFTCEDVVTLLTQLGSKVLLTEPGWGADRRNPNFKALLKELPFLDAVYEPENFPAASSTAARPLMPEQAGDPDCVTYLAFTSGTTGQPKCVMHSANSLLSNARDLARDWGLTSEANILSLSPLSHHIAWVAVGQWLVSGCKLITDDPPKGTSSFDWLLETKATYVMGVPTRAIDILAQCRQRKLETLGDVTVFYMAGSSIPPAVAESLVRMGIKPQNVYGMTENSSHQYTQKDDDLMILTTTCGRGGPAYEVKIFDTENPDREVAQGEVGQIAGRGAALMLGYYANQSATETGFNRDGWFLSGDLGSIDPRGNLSVEGRLKDLIIRGGHNINPSTIEALALRHPAIYKAAAFPMADERLGERVCLAIQGSVDADAVLAHLAAEGLSKYDMPEYFLTMEAFPLTASGKILKRELVNMAKRGEISPCRVQFEAIKESL